ncbi:hypothetical protein [Streptomyces sp. NPDC057545]|uniref:hypothetical protein n=1 Tax=Streptomyces sp. NPDC057545 TaxID=3346164 RepID=UPI0036B17911
MERSDACARAGRGVSAGRIGSLRARSHGIETPQTALAQDGRATRVGHPLVDPEEEVVRGGVRPVVGRIVRTGVRLWQPFLPAGADGPTTVSTRPPGRRTSRTTVSSVCHRRSPYWKQSAVSSAYGA